MPLITQVNDPPRLTSEAIGQLMQKWLQDRRPDAEGYSDQDMIDAAQYALDSLWQQKVIS